MGKILFIIIFLYLIGVACSGNTDNNKTHTGHMQQPKLSRRERKRIEKERRRAQEDAYEDFLMYYEVFHEDDWC